MAYYPKSQVRTGLYSNYEYTVLTSGEGYEGPYWINSKGQAYSGLSPADQSSKLLQKAPPRDETGYAIGGIGQEELQTQILNNEYALLKEINLDNLPVPPTPNPNYPTESDYNLGEFRRYFCKKANEVLYYELNKVTYDKLNNADPSILWELYTPFNIPWQLTGQREATALVNKRITDIAIKQKNLIGFAQFLKNDYLKYYRG